MTFALICASGAAVLAYILYRHKDEEKTFSNYETLLDSKVKGVELLYTSIMKKHDELESRLQRASSYYATDKQHKTKRLLQIEFDSLIEQKQILQRDYDQALYENRKLRADLKILEDELKQTREKEALFRDVQESNSFYSTQCHKLEAEVHSLKGVISAVQKEFMKVTAEKLSLEVEVRELRAQNTNLENLSLQTKKENKKLKKELHTLQNELIVMKTNTLIEKPSEIFQRRPLIDSDRRTEELQRAQNLYKLYQHAFLKNMKLQNNIEELQNEISNLKQKNKPKQEFSEEFSDYQNSDSEENNFDERNSYEEFESDQNVEDYEEINGVTKNLDDTTEIWTVPRWDNIQQGYTTVRVSSEIEDKIRDTMSKWNYLAESEFLFNWLCEEMGGPWGKVDGKELLRAKTKGDAHFLWLLNEIKKLSLSTGPITVYEDINQVMHVIDGGHVMVVSKDGGHNWKLEWIINENLTV